MKGKGESSDIEAKGGKRFGEELVNSIQWPITKGRRLQDLKTKSLVTPKRVGLN